MPSRYALASVSVGDLLRRVLPDEARKKIYGIGLIERRWAEAVGDELARRSAPDSLTEGVLTVRVADAAWGRMIVKHGPRVLAQLNRALGARLVWRVNFKVVSDFQTTFRPGPRPRPPLHATVPEAIAEAARSIEEDDLRETVSATAARYLARQNERNERRRGKGSTQRNA